MTVRFAFGRHAHNNFGSSQAFNRANSARSLPATGAHCRLPTKTRSSGASVIVPGALGESDLSGFSVFLFRPGRLSPAPHTVFSNCGISLPALSRFARAELPSALHGRIKNDAQTYLEPDQITDSDYAEEVKQQLGWLRRFDEHSRSRQLPRSCNEPECR